MQPGAYAGFEIDLQDRGIAVITFNHPDRLNGMFQAMKRDLVEVLAQAQLSDAVRVVIFTGSGRAFSAGDDISAHAEAPDPALAAPLTGSHATPMGTYDALRMLSQTVNTAIRDLDKITIAAINGYAIQTGLSLALACDFRIAASDARLGSATLRFGLLPDEGGHYLLVQLLGVGRTIDFLLRRRIVTAEEALNLGLVHEVVERESLLDRSLELAGELADGPQVAMRLLKRSIYTAADASFAHALDDIATKAAISDHHPDAREGIAAFREQRTPRFE